MGQKAYSPVEYSQLHHSLSPSEQVFYGDIMEGKQVDASSPCLISIEAKTPSANPNY
jgi:hypothetical protein